MAENYTFTHDKEGVIDLRVHSWKKTSTGETWTQVQTTSALLGALVAKNQMALAIPTSFEAPPRFKAVTESRRGGPEYLSNGNQSVHSRPCHLIRGNIFPILGYALDPYDYLTFEARDAEGSETPGRKRLRVVAGVDFNGLLTYKTNEELLNSNIESKLPEHAYTRMVHLSNRIITDISDECRNSLERQSANPFLDEDLKALYDKRFPPLTEQ